MERPPELSRFVARSKLYRMTVSLRQLSRSRRLLAMSLLAWLMLVIGTLQAAPVSAPAPMHPGMAMPAEACPPAATHVDASLHADCCHGDDTRRIAACPVALASALLPPVAALSLSGQRRPRRSMTASAPIRPIGPADRRFAHRKSDSPPLLPPW